LRTCPIIPHPTLNVNELLTRDTSSIKRLFKRWSVALEDLVVAPTPDLLAWRLSGRNGAFTPQELLATLAAAGDDWKQLHPGQSMPHTSFRGWGIAETPASSPRFTRVAIAPATIIKHFGSWHGALTAAGHADLIGRISSKYRSMPDDTVIALLRQGAEETRPGGPMRRSDYDHWAQNHEHTLQQTDPTAVVPRSLSQAGFGGGLDPGMLSWGEGMLLSCRDRVGIRGS
jgi:hypothetical protein